MEKRKHKKYPGVRRRGPNSFEINFISNGQRHYETVQASSEAQAFAVRLQKMTSPRKSQGIADFSLTDAIQYYLNQTEKLLQDNTRQRSLCIYNHLVDFLRATYPNIIFVGQITVEVGRKYKEHLLLMPAKSPSGINTDISKLRAIFKKFEEYGIIPANPFTKVEKIPNRLAKPEKKHLPTDHEIKVILNAVKGDPSYEELTMFLVRVGRRIEETTLYEKRDVLNDERGNPIKIIVRPEVTKTKEMGEVPMDEDLAHIVKRALEKNPGQAPLFTNAFQRKVTSNAYRDYLKRICGDYKLSEISPHCFRYYVVNKLLNSGINLKDAMAVTGHVDIESFMSYVKTTEEGRKKALAITKFSML